MTKNKLAIQLIKNELRKAEEEYVDKTNEMAQRVRDLDSFKGYIEGLRYALSKLESEKKDV